MPNPLDGKKAEATAYMQAVGMWCNKCFTGEDDSAEVEEVKAKRQALLDLGVPVFAIELLESMVFNAHADIVSKRIVDKYFKDIE